MDHREALKRLSFAIPLVFPVKVYHRDLGEGVFGNSELIHDKKTGELRGVIRLSKSLGKNEKVEVVCHEYAHLMQSTYPGQMQDAVWALAYSECYREIYGAH